MFNLVNYRLLSGVRDRSNPEQKQSRKTKEIKGKYDRRLQGDANAETKADHHRADQGDPHGVEKQRRENRRETSERGTGGLRRISERKIGATIRRSRQHRSKMRNLLQTSSGSHGDHVLSNDKGITSSSIHEVAAGRNRHVVKNTRRMQG